MRAASAAAARGPGDTLASRSAAPPPFRRMLPPPGLERRRRRTLARRIGGAPLACRTKLARRRCRCRHCRRPPRGLCVRSNCTTATVAAAAPVLFLSTGSSARLVDAGAARAKGAAPPRCAAAASQPGCGGTARDRRRRRRRRYYCQCHADHLPSRMTEAVLLRRHRARGRVDAPTAAGALAHRRGVEPQRRSDRESEAALHDGAVPPARRCRGRCAGCDRARGGAGGAVAGRRRWGGRRSGWPRCRPRRTLAGAGAAAVVVAASCCCCGRARRRRRDRAPTDDAGREGGRLRHGRRLAWRHDPIGERAAECGARGEARTAPLDGDVCAALPLARPAPPPPLLLLLPPPLLLLPPALRRYPREELRLAAQHAELPLRIEACEAAGAESGGPAAAAAGAAHAACRGLGRRPTSPAALLCQLGAVRQQSAAGARGGAGGRGAAATGRTGDDERRRQLAPTTRLLTSSPAQRACFTGLAPLLVPPPPLLAPPGPGRRWSEEMETTPVVFDAVRRSLAVAALAGRCGTGRRAGSPKDCICAGAQRLTGCVVVPCVFRVCCVVCLWHSWSRRAPSVMRPCLGAVGHSGR